MHGKETQLRVHTVQSHVRKLLWIIQQIVQNILIVPDAPCIEIQNITNITLMHMQAIVVVKGKVGIIARIKLIQGGPAGRGENNVVSGVASVFFGSCLNDINPAILRNGGIPCSLVDRRTVYGTVAFKAP